MRVITVIFLAALGLPSCSGDPNLEARYGEKTGLPKNCRAIVQANIDSWRAGEYTAEAVMDSLERNCGKNGHSWGQ